MATRFIGIRMGLATLASSPHCPLSLDRRIELSGIQARVGSCRPSASGLPTLIEFFP